MALTRDFRDTVLERAQSEPAYRRGLLTRGVAFMVSGDAEDRAVGRALIRYYINATIGFQRLGDDLGCKPQSLMRMFSSTGTPRLNSLADVVHRLQEHEGIHLEVAAK